MTLLLWTNEIPPEWGVRRLGSVAVLLNSNVDKKSYEDGHPIGLCNYTDVYYNDSITGSIAFMRATATAAERRRFLLRKGDVIITKDSESWNDIAIPACVREDLDNVVCGYHLTLIRADKERLWGPYLLRVLQASGIREQFWLAARGVTRFGLGQQGMKEVLIPAPPLVQQRALANLLDNKTAAIDALIAKKRKLVELLAEKRTALINQAVTKGLDPAVPMKDSGIPWVGEIPAHWSTTSISHYAHVFNGSTPTRSGPGFWEGDIPWLSSGKVNDWFITEATALISNEAVTASSLRLAPAGSVVIGMVGQGKTRGTSARLKISATINQNMAAIVPRAPLSAAYLHFSLVQAYKDIREFGRGGQQDALNCELVRSIRIALPPRVEQDRIAGFLDSAMEKTGAALVLINGQIERILEYRQALITAAVTGQVAINVVEKEPEELSV